MPSTVDLKYSSTTSYLGRARLDDVIAVATPPQAYSLCQAIALSDNSFLLPPRSCDQEFKTKPDLGIKIDSQNKCKIPNVSIRSANTDSTTVHHTKSTQHSKTMDLTPLTTALEEVKETLSTVTEQERKAALHLKIARITAITEAYKAVIAKQDAREPLLEAINTGLKRLKVLRSELKGRKAGLSQWCEMNGGWGKLSEAGKDVHEDEEAEIEELEVEYVELDARVEGMEAVSERLKREVEELLRGGWDGRGGCIGVVEMRLLRRLSEALAFSVLVSSLRINLVGSMGLENGISLPVKRFFKLLYYLATEAEIYPAHRQSNEMHRFCCSFLQHPNPASRVHSLRNQLPRSTVHHPRLPTVAERVPDPEAQQYMSRLCMPIPRLLHPNL